jgi:CubicO group peptidase (beta-lactamase class C family)/tetratricopeptide (TPR) repeat protein
MPFALVAAACALLTSVRAQETAASFDALLDIARRELRETRTPGATMALVDGDRVVFTGAVGTADIESGAPMRPEMLFRLGSTTKMFTAATLVTLAEERGVRLDSPIGAVVPGLNESIARLTPHQLLSHTSGLRDEAPMFGRHDEEALGEGVRAMTARMFFTEPASIYSYSNPGYWIAGFVAESLAGKPYADAVQTHIFAPLGMTRSTFRPTQAMTYPLAQGHEAPGSGAPTIIRPAANNAASWPAGSMFSNVQDLSRFVIAFMNGGRLDGKQALRPGAIEALAGRHALIPGGEAAYGYGLQSAERGGVTLVSHGGSRAGYGSNIFMVPSRRVAAIVLGNRTGSGLPITTRRGVEMLLGMPDGALDSTPTVTRASASERQAVETWAGRYSQGANAAIELAVKGDGLSVRENGREQPATLGSGLRLSVGAANGSAAPWVLVPDRDLRPGYIFRGGRSFRRLELTTPLGRHVFARPDTDGAIAKADAALAADPKNVDLILAAARARDVALQFGEAIAIYSRGLAMAPQDVRLLRFRGHRYISTRRFDLAVADLAKAVALAPSSFDVTYHLGLAHYLTGEFEQAARVYRSCLDATSDPKPLPTGWRSCTTTRATDNDRAAMSDWLYRAMRRAGRHDEARILAGSFGAGLKVDTNEAYYTALRFYQQAVAEDAAMTPVTKNENRLVTIGYGVATFHLANGDTAKACHLMRRIVEEPNWNAFGVIAAEADLARGVCGPP